MSNDAGAASGAAAATPADADRIKNLQAEMDRKLGNVHTELKKSHDALMSQLASLSQAVTPKKQETTVTDEDLGSLLYKDPNAFAGRLTEKVTSAISSSINANQQAQAKQNQVLSELVRDFPELSDENHELTKLAVKKYEALPADAKISPMAYKTAALDAALELDVKPKSKRPSNNDDGFTLSGGSSGPRQSRKERERISEATKQFAAIMGVSEEKVKARADKRKEFGRWE